MTFTSLTALKRWSDSKFPEYIPVDFPATDRLPQKDLVMMMKDGLYYYFKQECESIISKITFVLVMTSIDDLTKKEIDLCPQSTNSL